MVLQAAHNAVDHKVQPSTEYQVQKDVMVEAIAILDVLNKEKRRMMGKGGVEPKDGVCIDFQDQKIQYLLTTQALIFDLNPSPRELM